MNARWILSLPRSIVDKVFGYDFFIAYARSDGAAYAEKLLSELHRERFACCLDIHEYGVGDDLQNVMLRALKRSRILIVILSDGALKSSWVRREIEEFSRFRRRVVLVDAGSIGPERQREAFGNAFGENLLALRHNVGTLAQGPSSAVALEIKRAFNLSRRDQVRLRVFGAAALVFFVLALVAGTLAVLAQSSRDKAVRQENIAKQERDTAVSRQLAAQSLTLRETAYDLSLLFAAQGIDIASTPETEASLLKSLQTYPEIGKFLLRNSAIEDQRLMCSCGRVAAQLERSGGDPNRNKLLFWDLQTENASPYTWIPPTNSDYFGLLAISCDALVVALRDRNSALEVWQTRENKLLYKLEASPEKVWLSEDGTKMAVLMKEEGPPQESVGKGVKKSLLAVINLESAAQLTYREEKDVKASACSFSLDGDCLACLWGDNLLLLRLGIQGIELVPLDGEAKKSETLKFVAERGLLIVGGENIAVWRLSDKQRLQANLKQQTPALFPSNSRCKEIAVSRDGSSIALRHEQKKGSLLTDMLGSGTFKTWITLCKADPEGTIRCFHSFDLPCWTKNIAFGNNNRLIVLDQRGGVVETGPTGADRENHRLIVYEDPGVLSPAHRKMASRINSQKRVRIVDLDSWNERTLGLDDEGKIILHGFWDENAILLITEHGRAWKLGLEQAKTPNVSPEFSANAGANQEARRTVMLGELFQADPERFRFPDLLPKAMAWSQWSRRLAGLDASGTRVRLWDLSSDPWVSWSFSVTEGGKPAHRMALAPDGRNLVTITNKRPTHLVFWDAISGRIIGDPIQRDWNSWHVAFSSDGEILAVGVYGSLDLWKVREKSRIGQLLKQMPSADYSYWPEPVRKPLMIPSDAYLSYFKLWDMDPQSWKKKACEIANRNFTRAEWKQYLGERPYCRTCPDLPEEEDSSTKEPSALFRSSQDIINEKE